MELHEELEKIASSVEQDGFADIEESTIQKTAHALYALHSTKKDITKTAGFSAPAEQVARSIFGKRLGEGLFQTAVIGLGVSTVGRAMDAVESKYDDFKFGRKKKDLISFARSENKGLRGVSDKRMGMWLDSAYAVTPRVAKDPMLASTFLNAAHAVGGVDFNTAKTVAEIQQRGGKSYDKSYDAIRGSSSGLPSSLMIGD
jgi:hypothetical protein